ncbi:transglutaminase domain protein [Xylanimonas cellulosilytica DSM 15894]|uniref:Transglutaminase domain protein n=1 Tax=Xylanimonas cellulosilytica (strain DSM 15894 / JCM 12276 / CECT 5975 / KCTC 9989 / LMG 20990 / NBRC 107835 / XIL07) TaxID=446471 RepID=D1C0B4_XYLCX|nr:DUF3488 and transglutaminase-like domain-containing protein [Xylanimonas cellulosilytica]ACZ30303.1 transglutaminase domain protein [Xylanimonas cellulosilytica DSM 15894]
MIPARTPATTRLAVATALVVVAVLASMLALRHLVLPPWPAVGVTGVLLVGATLALTRGIIGGHRARVAAAARAGVAVRRPTADDGGTASAWPTLVGTAVALWYLLARFGGLGGATDWFVGPSSFGRLVDQLGLAGEVIRGEVAPVVGTPPMALLCVGGSLAVLLIADALAAGARHPLLASGTVLVLWFPPLVLMYAVPWTSFAVTVVALLLGLTLDGPPGARRALRDAAVGAQVRRAEGRRAVRTTATAAGITVVALVASTAAAGVQGTGGGWTGLFTTPSRTARLADDLDMYRSLSARSGAVVLRYTTSTGNDVGPLRLLTLASFDGRHWDGGRGPDGDEFAPDALLFPAEASSSAEPAHVELTVEAMREQRLPVATEPRTVQADGTWRYVPDRDEVVGDDATQDGDTFTMDVHPRELSPEILRTAAPGAGEVDDAYLAVPRTEHADDIAALARDIVGGALTDYDRAVALQRYLRDPSRFTYEPQVPPSRTGDAVWDFLEQRQGYCVQFATSMMLLARTLGIPARLGVGYLPGDPSDDDPDVREVTGRDSHAWPELFFPGSGWVRFEPTPAVQTGPVPAYANPLTGGPAPVPTMPTEEDFLRQGATGPAVLPSASPTGGAGGAGGGDTTERWLVGAGVLLLLGAGLTALALRRRSARPPADAEEAWSRVVGTLTTTGIALPPATTPRRAPGEAATAWEAHTGSELPWGVRDGISALAQELEVERYAALVDPDDDARTQRLDRLARLTREVTSGLTAARRSAARQKVGARR